MHKRDRYSKLALDYALEEGSGKMSEALQAIMGVPEGKWVSPLFATALPSGLDQNPQFTIILVFDHKISRSTDQELLSKHSELFSPYSKSQCR